MVQTCDICLNGDEESQLSAIINCGNEKCPFKICPQCFATHYGNPDNQMRCPSCQKSAVTPFLLSVAPGRGAAVEDSEAVVDLIPSAPPLSAVVAAATIVENEDQCAAVEVSEAVVDLSSAADFSHAVNFSPAVDLSVVVVSATIVENKDRCATCAGYLTTAKQAALICVQRTKSFPTMVRQAALCCTNRIVLAICGASEERRRMCRTWAAAVVALLVAAGGLGTIIWTWCVRYDDVFAGAWLLGPALLLILLFFQGVVRLEGVVILCIGPQEESRWCWPQSEEGDDGVRGSPCATCTRYLTMAKQAALCCTNSIVLAICGASEERRRMCRTWAAAVVALLVAAGGLGTIIWTWCVHGLVRDDVFAGAWLWGVFVFLTHIFLLLLVILCIGFYESRCCWQQSEEGDDGVRGGPCATCTGYPAMAKQTALRCTNRIVYGIKDASCPFICALAVVVAVAGGLGILVWTWCVHGYSESDLLLLFVLLVFGSSSSAALYQSGCPGREQWEQQQQQQSEEDNDVEEEDRCATCTGYPAMAKQAALCSTPSDGETGGDGTSGTVTLCKFILAALGVMAVTVGFVRWNAAQ